MVIASAVHMMIDSWRCYMYRTGTYVTEHLYIGNSHNYFVSQIYTYIESYVDLD